MSNIFKRSNFQETNFERKTFEFRNTYSSEFVLGLVTFYWGESLNTQMELGNVQVKYAVKALKNQAVVGHVLREISCYCSFV